jgi:putative endonuclease
LSKEYYVYIMTNKNNGVLYTGVTNDLMRRVEEHRTNSGVGFTGRYRVTKLLYYETFGEITLAIAREKQIKGGSRHKKMDLVNILNPEWRDLYNDIFKREY